MPLDALARFARGEATHFAAMRALASHDGWFVPIALATEHLFLFTDAEHARGQCSGPLAGSALFAKLPDGLRALDVNPGSPPTEGFHLDAESMPLARMWGEAIGLEKAIAGGAKDVIERLVAFEHYVILLMPPEMTIATAVGSGGLQNPGMAFTALDALVRVKEQLGANANALQQAFVRGDVLFEKVASLGIDGLILNPAGPGPTKVLNAALCAGLAQAAHARETTR